MRILLFRGKGSVSSLIRWQTRSQYSHVAIQLASGQVIEAWEGNIWRLLGSYLTKHVQHDGVRWHESLAELRAAHKPGTPIEAYDVVLPAERDAEQFLRRQVGKQYDLRSVARFLSRRDAPVNDRWFCSELACYAARLGGRPLLRMNCAHASPRDVAVSPLLVPVAGWSEL